MKRAKIELFGKEHTLKVDVSDELLEAAMGHVSRTVERLERANPHIGSERVLVMALFVLAAELESQQEGMYRLSELEERLDAVNYLDSLE